MRIISKKAIVDFYTDHADSQTALSSWAKKVEETDWSSFTDIKNDFNSADYVGNDRFVFNIKGNHYRLVALVLFIPKRVYIRFIGTHAEYDKIQDIENI
ncbi:MULTISPECIES: type II toxin-antitoxin system HigB family toxin [Capnocytophaga]|uniref:type II toxin-antitoxin system HigB family toxin n=1 Tax=Capnocytophaga TaxID=1016 RepID=UPI0015620D62|nr:MULTISPECIES: type II toxin-antitoxin system HigB family toxin [Capnocytophaga]